MSKPKTSEHMSKFKTKGDNLPSLQQAIVLHLAKKGPRTINKTRDKLEKSYKPTWVAFNSLEKKKLIMKIDVKEYRGREYPRFWLTAEGIIIALFEGADRLILFEESKSLFPDEKILHCFLEVIQHMNPMVIQLARNVVKKTEKLDFVALMTILVSEATYQSDVETMKKIVAVLKKYPEEYEQAKILIQQMIKQLKLLISD